MISFYVVMFALPVFIIVAAFVLAMKKVKRNG